MQTPYPTEFTSNNNTPALRSQRNHTFPSATTAYRSSSQSRMPLSSDDHFFVSTKLNNAQTNESLYELKNLLISWNLEEFYDYFIGQMPETTSKNKIFLKKYTNFFLKFQNNNFSSTF